jgi:2,3-bisphosphoglycerate-independent phosphoglycerate mutase
MAPKNLHFTTMTQYDKNFKAPFVLAREHPNNILADVMAQLQWKNLRVAETEKYAHVTYFFNGGNEKPYAGEEREMVAVAQGGHLRSEAGDERAGSERRSGEGD